MYEECMDTEANKLHVPTTITKWIHLRNLWLYQYDGWFNEIYKITVREISVKTPNLKPLYVLLYVLLFHTKWESVIRNLKKKFCLKVLAVKT